LPSDVKRARKDAEEKRKFADIEKMGIYNLENPSIPVKTMRTLPDAGLKKKSRWGLEENKMKLTAESLKQIIKEELSYGNRDDNAPMDIGEDPERVALNNLSAAIDSLVQNFGYTIEDVIDVVSAEEGSEEVYAMKGDQVVSMREGEKEEIEECGYPEPEEEEPKRYFKI
jgi:hypothetical protein